MKPPAYPHPNPPPPPHFFISCFKKCSWSTSSVVIYISFSVVSSPSGWGGGGGESVYKGGVVLKYWPFLKAIRAPNSLTASSPLTGGDKTSYFCPEDQSVLHWLHSKRRETKGTTDVTLYKLRTRICVPGHQCALFR